MNNNDFVPKWDLSLLYNKNEQDKILSDALLALEFSEKFNKKYKGKIKDNNVNAEIIFEILKKTEHISELIAKPSSFIFLKYSQDISDKKIKRLLNNIEEIGTQISNNLLFFTLEFNALNDSIKNKLLSSKILENHKHYLQRIIDEKKFQLKEEEEKIINLKSITGINAFKKLYSNITTKYLFKIKINDVEQTLTESEILQLRYDSDWQLRRKSSQIQFAKYESDGEILSEIYNNIIKDLSIENNFRGFKSNIAAENFANELSDKAIYNLIETTNSYSYLLKDFFKTKAEVLNVKKLRLCDTRVSLDNGNNNYSWNDAKNIILEAFSEFDNRFYKIAKDFFDENRIHAKLLKNKMEDAFCYYSSPKITPYILTNFLGKRNDIITLAHELGHGIHGILSSKQNIVNYWSVLPFAEIASIFAELLVTEKLLNITDSKFVKRGILMEKVNDIIASTFRQNMFTNFELKAHKNIKKGFTGFDELTNIYFDEIKNLFGESVDILEEYKFEWLSIPHLFVTPFYCYSYNFAQLFVLGLYELYLEEGNKFKEKYFELLESGGKDSPEKLARIVSININDTRIWEKGFNLIETKFLTELKNII